MLAEDKEAHTGPLAKERAASKKEDDKEKAEANRREAAARVQLQNNQTREARREEEERNRLDGLQQHRVALGGSRSREQASVSTSSTSTAMAQIVAAPKAKKCFLCMAEISGPITDNQRCGSTRCRRISCANEMCILSLVQHRLSHAT